MEKRMSLFVIVLIVLAVSSSTVLALPPMGPPKAFLGQDQWALSLGYAYSQMDLQAYGRVQEDQGAGWLPATYSKHTIEDFTSNIVLGSLGYGVSDNWDVFVCLGVSDAQGDMSENRLDGSLGNEYSGLDCSFGYAWGFGTRATFWRDGDVIWGGLFQATWQNPGDGSVTLKPTGGDPSRLTGDVELDLSEIQIAVGPTVQLDSFCIYGGPFFHFVKGDADVDVTGEDSFGATWRVTASQDIREESQLGIYAGAQWRGSETISWFAEYRMTGDAWGIGLGAILKFQ